MDDNKKVTAVFVEESESEEIAATVNYEDNSKEIYLNEVHETANIPALIEFLTSNNTRFAELAIDTEEGQLVFEEYLLLLLEYSLADEKLILMEAEARGIKLTDEIEEEYFQEYIESLINEIPEVDSEEELMDFVAEELGIDSREEFKEYFLEHNKENIVFQLLLEETGIETQEELDELLEEIREEALIQINEEKVRESLEQQLPEDNSVQKTESLNYSFSSQSDLEQPRTNSELDVQNNNSAVIAEVGDREIQKQEVEEIIQNFLFELVRFNPYYTDTLMQTSPGKELLNLYRQEELEPLINRNLMLIEIENRNYELTEEDKDEIFAAHIEELKELTGYSDEDEILEYYLQEMGFYTWDDYREYFFAENEEDIIISEFIKEEFDNEEEIETFIDNLKEEIDIVIYEDELYE